MPERGRIKRFLNLVPALLGWAALMLVLWGFIFLRLDDAPPENRLVIYAECDVSGARDLMVQLEDAWAAHGDESAFAGTQIRKIKLYTTSFFSVLSDPLKDGDLFIVSEEALRELGDKIAPLPTGRFEEMETLENRGILFYDASRDVRRGEKHFLYNEDRRYYLCFSADSLHAGVRDESAYVLAEILLNTDLS